MEKRLIINADEFGLTKGVNEAIIKAHKFGTVTSTTMMVNMWAFDNAVYLAKENSDLGVGIHLNLTAGRPVLSADEVATLVNRKGYFYDRRSFLKNLSLGKVNIKQLEQELEAQISKLVSSGIALTHIDTHQNIYIHRKVFTKVTQLASKLHIPMRFHSEKLMLFPSKQFRYFRRLYRYAVFKWRKNILKRQNISTPDSFYGIADFFTNRYCDEDLLIQMYQDVLSGIPTGVTELMVHPGYADEQLISFTHGSRLMAQQREEELKVLLNPELKEIFDKFQIKLINFRHLS